MVLQDLVATRTKALNRQTARLNVASKRLREARNAIDRSEEDVANLEVRQRELANEKAQVEDQRAALLRTASQLQACNSGLGQLIQVLAGGLSPNQTDVDNVIVVCDGANQAVDAYLQVYGSE